MWFPVYKREIGAYLHSPVLYVIGGVFLFLVAYFSLGMMVEFSDVYTDFNMRQIYGMGSMNVTEWVIQGFFGLLNFLLLFTIPLLTMRLFAEEKRNRTFELLVTCPIRDGEILAGKFLSCMTVLLFFLGSCFIYPLLVDKFSEPEWPVIATGYLGLFLAAGAYLSFGVFASSVTENQVIAAFLTFGGLLFFYLVGDVTSSREGLLGQVSSVLSIRQHSAGFAKGVIEIRDLIYFASFIAFFLFLSLECLKIRRWRG